MPDPMMWTGFDALATTLLCGYVPGAIAISSTPVPLSLAACTAAASVGSDVPAHPADVLGTQNVAALALPQIDCHRGGKPPPGPWFASPRYYARCQLVK